MLDLSSTLYLCIFHVTLWNIKYSYFQRSTLSPPPMYGGGELAGYRDGISVTIDSDVSYLLINIIRLCEVSGRFVATC